MMAKWKLCHLGSQTLCLIKNSVLRGLWIRNTCSFFGTYDVYFSTKNGNVHIACLDIKGKWYGNRNSNGTNFMKAMSIPDIAQNVIAPLLCDDQETQHYSKFVVSRHEEIWNAMSDSNPFIQRDDWTVRYLVLGLNCSYPVVYAVMAALWVVPEEVVE